ncbi:MAG: two pore domain potassium channel family protein [Deltaproteobacteria bacterium]|nr:two pore domain potassium channel family protein [Deltaproteobacteria bacterium]
MPSTDPPNVSSNQLDGLVPLIPVALGLLGDGNDLSALKQGLRKWAKQDPMDALLATVIGGGLAYYLAERHTNASCKNPWDGILYMATALSVGYDNLFPVTTTGHALATFVQTFGPSLAAGALEPTAADDRANEAAQNTVQLAILERLDRIVHLLERTP